MVSLVFSGVELDAPMADETENVKAQQAVVKDDVDDTDGGVRKLLQILSRRFGKLGESHRLLRSQKSEK